nr:MAG TPA: minor capsid protein [Caudoviricetes sp.]
MKSTDYWEKRALRDKKFATNRTEDYIKNKLSKAYSEVSKELEEEIKALYEKLDKSKSLLAQSNEKLLTSTKASEIKELLNKLNEEKEKLTNANLPKEVSDTIEKNIKLIEESLRMKSKSGYITHLEMMQERVNSLALSVANENQINMYDYLAKEYTDDYFRGVFRVQQGMGFGKDFISPNPKLIQNVIMRSYAGSSFSKRIWKDVNKLGITLKDTLTKGFIRGDSIDTMTKRLLERVEVSKSHAKMLIRTESARVCEEATKDAYKECGIEQYIYLATLDRKTSLICQELDMKSFPLKDAKIGENYPPMHPNCRSTTMADTKPLKRIARGADGKNYEVDGNLSYKDWYDGLSKDEQGRMSLENKKDANRKRDKEELDKIRDIAGKKDTPSIAKYQSMKYNNTEEFRLLKGYTRGINKGDISALVGFDNYKDNAEKLRSLVGQKTSDGLEIKGFSTHMVDRLIGQMSYSEMGLRSKEERKGIRFGVTKDMVQDTLKNGEITNRQYDDNGNEISRVYKTSVCKVAFNPTTGNMIQTNPYYEKEKK